MEPLICQECGAPLPPDDPLGGDLCAACLWKELMPRPQHGGPAYRDMVPGHEILGELGRGGMGLVYRARQITPAREVALKMLLPLDSGHAELRERFRGEARALAELEHSAILPLYQVGEVEGLPYFTMKLASGGTLARRLSVEDQWQAKTAADLIVILADAVQYAHERGVIHRDLKPGNILFDDAGRPYVADFGLAKFEADAHSHTRSAGILGTPAYMAPEIASFGARAATIASDVYSLGAIFYELLTGRPPFEEDDVTPILRKITESQPAAPSTLNNQVPRDLEIICLKCLRKTTTDRYASAREFADDVRRWLRGEPILAREITPAQRLVKWAQRRPALAALSASLIAVLVGAALWLSLKNQQLEQALSEARKARAISDSQAAFIVDDLMDPLQKLGRLDILDPAFKLILSTDVGQDDGARARRAQTHRAFGRSLLDQGRPDEAGKHLRIAEQEAASLPDTNENYLLHVQSKVMLARAVSETGDGAEVGPQLVTLDEQIQARAAGSDDLLFVRARKEVMGLVARLGSELRPDSNTVAGWCATYIDLAKTIALRQPDDFNARLAWGEALELDSSRLISLLREPEKFQANAASVTLARTRQAELAALAADLGQRQPIVPLAIRFQAVALLAAATLQEVTEPGKLAEAYAKTLEACSLLDGLAAADLSDFSSRLEAASIHHHAAHLSLAMGQEAQADTHFARQLALTRELRQRSPATRQWSMAHLNSSTATGLWKLRQGDTMAAEPLLLEAINAALLVIGPRLGNSREQNAFSQSVDHICRAWREAGQPEKIRLFQKAVLDGLDRLTAEGRSAEACAWLAARCQRRFADESEAAGDLESALSWNLSALRLRSDLFRREVPVARSDPRTVISSYEATTRVSLALGRFEEALGLVDEALALRRACRGFAGPPEPWASTVLPTLRAARAREGTVAATARRFAEQALHDLYPAQPPADQESLGENDRNLIETLQALVPPTTPHQSSENTLDHTAR